ncbi:Rz1-like lysis system protein LysC [Variovorax sp. GT1P44]|uniref:Rz1-like lysis system protein LysC n=1 Tax=Variovorax sp. GT1P44 TaxID=3443742 RepID=UPI003F479F6D
MLCGTACTAPQRLLPPLEWLEDCPLPERPAERTNAALAGAVAEHRTVIELCNADKAALREWAK